MKKAIAAMSVYGLGGILARLVQFVLLPLYTRFLFPADYGSLEVVAVIGNILAILYGLLIGSGFVRYYFERDDGGYRQELFGSALWFTFAFSLVFVTGSFLFTRELTGGFLSFPDGDLYFRLITLSTFVTVHNQIFYNLLMVREQARLYVVLNLTTLVLSLGCTVLFVAFLGWGVTGILSAQLFAFCVEAVLLVAATGVQGVFAVSRTRIAEMLRYSLPLIPLQVSAFVLEMADRYFIQEYRGLDDVGLYALGYRFAAIVPLLAVQPLKGFTPYIFSLVNSPEKCKQTLADFFRYYFAGILFLAFGIASFSREVIRIVADPSYHESWRVVFVLCISYVFYGGVVLASYAIEIVKKNWLSGIFWVVAAALNLGLNIMLIPRWGVSGAAAATALSYLAILICYFIVISKVYTVPFQYAKFLLLFAGTVFFYSLSTMFPADMLVSVPSKIALSMVFLAVLLMSGYFTSDEVARLKTFCAGTMRSVFR